MSLITQVSQFKGSLNIRTKSALCVYDGKNEVRHLDRQRIDIYMLFLLKMLSVLIMLAMFVPRRWRPDFFHAGKGVYMYVCF